MADAIRLAHAVLAALWAEEKDTGDPATLRATILSGAWDLPQGKVTFDPSGQGLSQQILVVGKGDDVVAAGK